MAGLLGVYQNGNYLVELYSDGTKIRQSASREPFVPAFAESMDVTITSKCDGLCPYCYADCTPDGQHGELLDPRFLDSLHPFTEVAINGNDLSHPQLGKFLWELKKRKVIANLTVSQKHFMDCYEALLSWMELGLIYGLGVSYKEKDVKLLRLLPPFKHAVIHVINGVVSSSDIAFLANIGGEYRPKLLILGYKELGRGREYRMLNPRDVHNNMRDLKACVRSLPDAFDVVSFDNLALEQLDIKSNISPELWEQVYMGNEGQFTFYVDLVKNTFARSSLETEQFPIPESRNVDDMFHIIQEKEGSI
jgi:hypothetical protein